MIKRPCPWLRGYKPRHLPKEMVVVCGTRDFEDEGLFIRVMDDWLYWRDGAEFVIGGDGHRTERGGEWVWTGADYYANYYATCNWVVKHLFRAEWGKYGKSAGPRRNKDMAEFAASFPRPSLVAFWNGRSPGTKNMIHEFTTRNPTAKIKVVRYNHG